MNALIKEEEEKRILFKKSFYMIVTLLLRTFNISMAPENTLFKTYTLPVYIVYTMFASFFISLAINLSDRETVSQYTLTVSLILALYDTSFSIHQSIFDVCIRTGVAVLCCVIIERVYLFIRFRLLAYCFPGERGERELRGKIHFI